MIFVTIGIPTFNEIAYIDATFEAIVKQILGAEQQVELIIIDNGSTDGTISYLNELQNKKIIPPNLILKLVYNGENRGINYSLDYLLNACRGEYLWIVGAQDHIQNMAFSVLLQLIKSKPELIITNALIRDENTNTIINQSLYGEIESKTFTSTFEFFLDLGGPSQAISCNIFNVNKVRKVSKNKLISEQWWHIERLCDVVWENRDNLEIKFLSTPLIEMLIESNGWQVSGVDNSTPTPKIEYGPFFVMLQLTEIANYKFKGIPQLRYMFSIYRDPFAIPRAIIQGKAKGLPVNIALIIRCVKAYRSSILFWLIGLPTLISPRFLQLAPLLINFKPAVHYLRKAFKIPVW